MLYEISEEHFIFRATALITCVNCVLLFLVYLVFLNCNNYKYENVDKENNGENHVVLKGSEVIVVGSA